MEGKRGKGREKEIRRETESKSGRDTGGVRQRKSKAETENQKETQK